MRFKFGSIKLGTLFLLFFIIMCAQFGILQLITNEQQYSQYYEETEKELVASSMDFYELADDAQRICALLSTDVNVIKALNMGDCDFSTEKQLKNLFIQMKKINLNINSIYVYNIQKNVIYSDSVVYKGEHTKLLENLVNKEYKGEHQMEVFCEELYDNSKVICVRLKPDKKSNNGIIVTFSYLAVDEMFFNFKKNVSENIAIVKSDENIIYRTGENSLFEDGVNSYKQKAKKSNFIRYNGKKYMFFSEKIANSDFVVYSLKAVNEIKLHNSPTRIMLLTNSILILIFIFCVLGVVIFRRVRTMGKEISRITTINQQYEIYKMNQNKKLHLINCLYSLHNRDVLKAREYLQSKSAGEDFKFEKIVLMRIEVLDFIGFKTNHSYKDNALYEYGIMNLCEEIVKNNFDCELLYFKDGYIDVILAYNDDYILKSKNVQKELNNMMKLYIKHDVSVFVTQADDFEKIASLYTQLVDIAEYRFFFENPVMLDYNILFDEKDSDLKPEREKIINECCEKILSGEFQKAFFEEIPVRLKGSSPDFFRKTFWYILFEISNRISVMKKNFVFNSEFEFSKYFVKMETLQCFTRIYEILMELMSDINMNKKSENSIYSRNVSAAMEIIHNNYMKENFYSNEIAKELGISNEYLVKIFKKEVGVSVSETINDLRLISAAEKILSTDMSISDILKAVGVTNHSYFGVQFRKKFGMSPSEYRKRK